MKQETLKRRGPIVLTLVVAMVVLFLILETVFSDPDQALDVSIAETDRAPVEPEQKRAAGGLVMPSEDSPRLEPSRPKRPQASLLPKKIPGDPRFVPGGLRSFGGPLLLDTFMGLSLMHSPRDWYPLLDTADASFGLESSDAIFRIRLVRDDGSVLKEPCFEWRIGSTPTATVEAGVQYRRCHLADETKPIFVHAFADNLSKRVFLKSRVNFKNFECPRAVFDWKDGKKVADWRLKVKRPDVGFAKGGWMTAVILGKRRRQDLGRSFESPYLKVEVDDEGFADVSAVPPSTKLAFRYVPADMFVDEVWSESRRPPTILKSPASKKARVDEFASQR